MLAFVLMIASAKLFMV